MTGTLFPLQFEHCSKPYGRSGSGTGSGLNSTDGPPLYKHNSASGLPSMQNEEQENSVFGPCQITSMLCK
jgi:hypothetical protein